jgi:hypothetical protein
MSQKSKTGGRTAVLTSPAVRARLAAARAATAAASATAAAAMMGCGGGGEKPADPMTRPGYCRQGENCMPEPAEPFSHVRTLVRDDHVEATWVMTPRQLERLVGDQEGVYEVSIRASVAKGTGGTAESTLWLRVGDRGLEQVMDRAPAKDTPHGVERHRVYGLKAPGPEIGDAVPYPGARAGEGGGVPDMGDWIERVVASK